MGKSQRRIVLYVSSTVIVAGLLFAGYGITVPPDAGTRLNGAALLAGMGDIEGALDVCSKVLEEHPQNLDARVFKATFLAQAKRFDEALAAYDDALDHAGDDAELRANLRQDRAGVLLDTGRWEEFEAERDRLAAVGPDHRVFVLDGYAAERREDWAGAVAAYRKAGALEPTDESIKARLWHAHMQRGRAALAAGRLEEALASFEAASPIFPTATDAPLRAAEVRLALGHPKEALDALRALPPRTPGVAALVLRGATALLEREDTEGAFAALEGAFAADPSGTRTLFDKEPAWDAYRNSPALVAIIEKFFEAGLTGKE